MLLVTAYSSLKCSSSTQILIIYYSVGGLIAKVIVDYTGLAMQSLSIIAALIEHIGY